MSRSQEIEKAIQAKTNPANILEMIMDEYGTDLKRLIYTYVKDWEIASDLTQETFITVYEKLQTFEQRSSFKTWLFSIAINKSKDYLKSWHFRNLLLNNKMFFLNKDTERSPESHIIAQSEQNHIVQVIMTLAIKYREVLLLYYYQELTFQEISTTLNLPLGTVKSRLYRGQDKLKKILSQESGEWYGRTKERSE